MLLLLLVVGGLVHGGEGQNSISAVDNFLKQYNKEAKNVYFAAATANWNYNTNMTDYNKNQTIKRRSVTARFAQDARNNASKFDLKNVTAAQRRQLITIIDIGTLAETNQTNRDRLPQVLYEMQKIFMNRITCAQTRRCGQLDPADLPTGSKMKKLFTEYVDLSNKAVRNLGHVDVSAYWRWWYEKDNHKYVDGGKNLANDYDLMNDVEAVLKQIRPLIEQLIIYARRRLMEKLGDPGILTKSGHISVRFIDHLTYETLVPFKSTSLLNVTDEMIKQNYTAIKIFKKAEDFFKSLGLFTMPKEFWDKSLLERPKDGRVVLCEPSAHDFFNGKDFRIKQCTEINEDNLYIAHHEMGHIQYFMAYKEKPHSFRRGANPGFHEALGDTISLSVQTHEYLKTIKLIKEVNTDQSTDINYLMKTALKKILYLPSDYIIELWRWEVFSGNTSEPDYNKRWWELSCKYQGISPSAPIDSQAFFMGRYYHIVHNLPYIRYFVGNILQFQFLNALCKKADHKGPLHRCNIFNSRKSGSILKKAMSLGSSKPWSEVLHMLTGQKKMDGRPLMTYFKPLLDFLKKENGKESGWKPKCSF